MNQNFNFNNFNKDNTPPWLAKIGNACLIIGVVGGAVALAPVSTPAIATIGAWAAWIGGVGKLLSKMGGTNNEAENRVEK